MNKKETLAEKIKKRHPSYAGIARKYRTNNAYVWQIAHGLRNPVRGKGLKIKQELEKLAQ